MEALIGQLVERQPDWRPPHYGPRPRPKSDRPRGRPYVEDRCQCGKFSSHLAKKIKHKCRLKEAA